MRKGIRRNTIKKKKKRK